LYVLMGKNIPAKVLNEDAKAPVKFGVTGGTF
jgi:hypothetical protein